MAFKGDHKSQSNSIQRSDRGQTTTRNGVHSKDSKGSETFTIDRTTLMGSILPPGGQQFMEEISKGLGIDLMDPKGWSKEQVINAKKLASELDEKMMMMVGAIRCVVNHGKQSVNNYTNLAADYCH